MSQEKFKNTNYILILFIILFTQCGSNTDETELEEYFFGVNIVEIVKLKPEEYRGIPTENYNNCFTENFSDNANNWQLETNSKITISIKSDFLYIYTGTGNWFIWNKFLTATFDRNFEINAKIRFKNISKSGTPVGIVWGLKNTTSLNCNCFLIYGSDFITGKYDNDEFTNYTSGAFQRPDYTQPVILTIRKYGTFLYYFVNSELVSSFEYKTYFGDNIGFFVSEDNTIEIDWLRVDYIK